LVPKTLTTDSLRLENACELLSERVRVKNGRFVLPVDKKIFQNLEKSAKKRFDISAALVKSRSPINILQSTATPNEEKRTVDFATADLPPNVELTSVLQCTQISWKDKQLLLPAVGLFAYLLAEECA
jgi:hypothetical protein